MVHKFEQGFSSVYSVMRHLKGSHLYAFVLRLTGYSLPVRDGSEEFLQLTQQCRRFMLVSAVLLFGGCSLLGTKSSGDLAVLQVEKQSDASRQTVTLKITYENTTSETVYLPRGHESCIDMEVQKKAGKEWRTAVAYGCIQVVEPPQPLKPEESISRQKEVDLSASVEVYDWMKDTAGTYRYQARIGYREGDNVEYVTQTSNTFEVD